MMTSELSPEPIDNASPAFSDESFIIIPTWVLFPSAIFMPLEPLRVAPLVSFTVVLEPVPLPILLLPVEERFELSISSVAVDLFPVAILKLCPTVITLLSDMVTDISDSSPIPTLTLPITSILDFLSIFRDSLPAADTPPRMSPLTVTLLSLSIFIVEAFSFGAPSTPVETIKS